jgi:hypothetical protein
VRNLTILCTPGAKRGVLIVQSMPHGQKRRALPNPVLHPAVPFAQWSPRSLFPACKFSSLGHRVADDNAAIHAALADRDILFPPGTYKTTSAIEV